MDQKFLDEFYSENRMVAFLSHRLFTAGKLKDNIANIDIMAKDITEMGFTVIRPTTLAPWLIKDGKEVNRHMSMRICQSVILIVSCVIYDVNKQSKGTQEELAFARLHKVPIIEYHYLKGLVRR